MRKRQVLVLVFLASPLMLGAGGECGTTDLNSMMPSATTVRVEMVNDTGYQLDPGVSFNGGSNLSNTIQPGNTLVFASNPCGASTTFRFAGHSLAVAPVFLTDADAVEVTVGAEFSCGDTIRVDYTVSGDKVVNTVTAN